MRVALSAPPPGTTRAAPSRSNRGRAPWREVSRCRGARRGQAHRVEGLVGGDEPVGLDAPRPQGAARSRPRRSCPFRSASSRARPSAPAAAARRSRGSSRPAGRPRATGRLSASRRPASRVSASGVRSSRSPALSWTASRPKPGRGADGGVARRGRPSRGRGRAGRAPSRPRARATCAPPVQRLAADGRRRARPCRRGRQSGSLRVGLDPQRPRIGCRPWRWPGRAPIRSRTGRDVRGSRRACRRGPARPARRSSRAARLLEVDVEPARRRRPGRPRPGRVAVRPAPSRRRCVEGVAVVDLRQAPGDSAAPFRAAGRPPRAGGEASARCTVEIGRDGLARRVAAELALASTAARRAARPARSEKTARSGSAASTVPVSVFWPTRPA